MNRKRIAIATAILLTLILAVGGALVALDRFETVEQSFATYSEAQGAGFDHRGWMPDFVPTSATGIHAAQNLDTNWQWLTFHSPAAALHALLSEGGRVKELPRSRAPFWLRWWSSRVERPGSGSPVVLVRLNAAPSGIERHVRCLAADTTTGVVYAWSC